MAGSGAGHSDIVPVTSPKASVEELAQITGDLRKGKSRRWLRDAAESVKTALLNDLRATLQEPYVDPSELDDTVVGYLDLKDEADALERRLVEVRQRLARYWAQHGFQKSQKLGMITPLELVLRVEPVLKKLPWSIYARVVHPVPTFDLAQFLILVDRGEIKQDIVVQHLAGKVEIQPRKTKDASAPKDEEE